MKISRALISVSDKSGIAAFTRALERQGVDIISTGGTAELLRKEKIPVREISSFTAFPEVLEGRVKTLHPRVHGGLLYKRGNPKHEAEARECGFEPIDLVVVNLYPFEKTIRKPNVTLAEAIENIDIGGPSPSLNIPIRAASVAMSIFAKRGRKRSPLINKRPSVESSFATARLTSRWPKRSAKFLAK